MFLEQRFSSCGSASVSWWLCLLWCCSSAESLFSPFILLDLLVGRPPVLGHGQLLQPDQRALGQRCRSCSGVWGLGFVEQMGSSSGGAEGEVPVPVLMDKERKFGSSSCRKQGWQHCCCFSDFQEISNISTWIKQTLQ